MSELILKSKIVGKLLDNKLDGVDRTALVLEGFGINHVHVKLYPLHRTPKQWKPIKSTYNKYFERYEGYISSRHKISYTELEKLADKLRK